MIVPPHIPSLPIFDVLIVKPTKRLKELSRGKGTDGWTAQQQKRLNRLRRFANQTAGQTTTQAVLSRTQTYKDENREFETKAMSPAAALTFNYNRNTEILRFGARTFRP